MVTINIDWILLDEEISSRQLQPQLLLLLSLLFDEEEFNLILYLPRKVMVMKLFLNGKKALCWK